MHAHRRHRAHGRAVGMFYVHFRYRAAYAPIRLVVNSLNSCPSLRARCLPFLESNRTLWLSIIVSFSAFLTCHYWALVSLSFSIRRELVLTLSYHFLGSNLSSTRPPCTPPLPCKIHWINSCNDPASHFLCVRIVSLPPYNSHV